MAFDRLARLVGKERWDGFMRNRRLIYCTVVINMGALLLGYDSGIAGAIIPLRAFKYDMGIDGTRTAVATVNSNVVSILFGGAFFGSIFTAWFSFYQGRRAALMYSMILFMLGGALQTAAKNLKWIYAGRFISGLAVGATSLVAPYFIAEISPSEHRARTVGAFQAFLVAGSLLAYWVTYGCDIQFHPTTAIVNLPAGTNTTGTADPGAPADPAGTTHLDFHSAQWRVPVGIQMLPGVFFSILMVGVCESPRWLAGKDRKDEAIKTLAWLRCVEMDEGEDREGNDSGSDKDSIAGREKGGTYTSTPAEEKLPSLARENHVSIAATPPAHPENAPTISLNPRMAAVHEEYAGIQAQLDETRGARLRELFSSANIKRFTTSTFIAVFHIWTFHTGILYYAPTVFKNIGFSDTRSALLASGVFGVVKFVSTIAALAFTIHRYGRVTGMVAGTAAHAVLFFILGAILKTYPPHGGPIKPASIAMMALLYLYVIVYSFGMGPIPWVYSSEIYPFRIREMGQMWFTALTWACNFATSRVTPILFVKLGWKTWMLFAAINGGGSIMCWLICPETKGLNMEEIDILFGAISAEQRAADIERVLHGQGDGSRLNTS
ncbi:general substrate transporter [Ceratobasidium sp. AG-I]|nr:general substrate transporter [Ceratobasidium sp. AG-I]